MMEHIIENDWTTKSGLRAVGILIPDMHRCGYVGVPKEHPLYGLESRDPLPSTLMAEWEQAKEQPVGNRGVMDIFMMAVDGEDVRVGYLFDVHGSITYSGGMPDYPAESDGLWWFGFGCDHCNDGSLDPHLLMYNTGKPVRSAVFVKQECERLADQLAKVTAEKVRQT